ncbi:MAG: adenylate kinase [Candidatus Omnitrophica bacterium]|nr:adenylate kinase [Candidatus Omnitrophota bacterium]
MRLVLLGPPGAGKGTHAKILSEKFKADHLATGDILRQHIREKTTLGAKAKDIIETGNLVPDALVNEMMFEEISRVGKKAFILDGYPRTIGQAESLDVFLKKQTMKLDAVLDFETSEQVIIDRLSGRRVCTKCGGNYHTRNIPPKKEGVCDKCGEMLVQRKDDTPVTIQHRLEMYLKETSPLIQYYKRQNILVSVPGDYDVPELQTVLKTLFDEMKLAV